MDSRRHTCPFEFPRRHLEPIQQYSHFQILVGLCYDDKHEVVSVSIEKASSLGADIAHPPDSFIRIISLDEFNTELSRHKTDTVKHSTQPVYSHHCTMRVSGEGKGRDCKLKTKHVVWFLILCDSLGSDSDRRLGSHNVYSSDNESRKVAFKMRK